MHPLKQVSPETKSSRGRRRAFSGSQQQGVAEGWTPVTLPGSRSMACRERDEQGLGRPMLLPEGGVGEPMAIRQTMAAWESDRSIVLGDGRADHTPRQTAAAAGQGEGSDGVA